MADSLSYQEAVSKGLVYPGSEEAALKLTGGGKGFASTEAFKKAFETSYQAKKSEVDVLGKRISELSAINAEANRLRAAAAGASTKAYGGMLNRYFNYLKSTEFWNKAPNYSRTKQSPSSAVAHYLNVREAHTDDTVHTSTHTLKPNLL